MTLRLRCGAGLVLAVALATTVSAGSASAETGHRRYAQGDAPAAIDIVGLRASNGISRLAMTITVPALTTRGRFTLGWEGRYYDGMALTVSQHDGRIATRLFHCGEDSCVRATCAGIDVRWSLSAKTIRAIVPQRCYPSRVPKAWTFHAYSVLGDAYDDGGRYLRLVRG